MKVEIMQRKFFFPSSMRSEKNPSKPSLEYSDPRLCFLTVAIREIIFWLAGLHHPAAISAAE